MGDVRVTSLEARLLALVALALLVGGGVWVFGPVALLVIGVLLLVVALFGPIDEGRERRESVSAAAARRP